MRKSFILIAVILSAFGLATSVQAEESQLVSLKFDQSGKIESKKKTYHIPTYLPYLEKGQGKDGDPIYSTYDPSSLNDDHVLVIFGLSENCFKENFCGFATFSNERIGGHLQSILMETLETYAPKIQLEMGHEGYYVPSKCYATCNATKLIWFKEDRIFMIGTTFGGDDKKNKVELQKAANSLIEQPVPNDPALPDEPASTDSIAPIEPETDDTSSKK